MLGGPNCENLELLCHYNHGRAPAAKVRRNLLGPLQWHEQLLYHSHQPTDATRHAPPTQLPRFSSHAYDFYSCTRYHKLLVFQLLLRWAHRYPKTNRPSSLDVGSGTRTEDALLWQCPSRGPTAKACSTIRPTPKWCFNHTPSEASLRTLCGENFCRSAFYGPKCWKQRILLASLSNK
jgi:hypothetical protein